MSKLITWILGSLISATITSATTTIETNVPKTPLFDSKDVILTPILEKIAFCESGNRHFDNEGKVIRGKVNPADVGRFQINEYYHGAKAREMGLDLMDENDNARFALYLYENYGVAPWLASKSCWEEAYN